MAAVEPTLITPAPTANARIRGSRQTKPKPVRMSVRIEVRTVLTALNRPPTVARIPTLTAKVIVRTRPIADDQEDQPHRIDVETLRFDRDRPIENRPRPLPN